MYSFTAIGSRFIVGRDRLSFQTGGALARAGAKFNDIPDMPATLVWFDGDLRVEELDLTVADQLAIQAGLDPKRWYEGIAWKHA